MFRRLFPRAVLPALAAALIVFASVSSPIRADDRPGRKFALLVGVNDYKNHSLRPLKYPVADVTALGRVLASNGYKEDNIWTMTLAAATRDPKWIPNRENLLDSLRALLKNRQPNESVLVALAGHGVQFMGDNESYFCPIDADIEQMKNLVALSEIYDALKRCRAGVKLLVVDACRNDPLADGSRGGSLSVRVTSPLFQKVPPPGGVAVLYSCSAGQQAFEDDDLKHGVFSHFLIKGLGGAAGSNGRVRLGQLFDYVAENVEDYTSKHKSQAQVPTFRSDDLNGLVTLVSRAPERAEPPLSRPTPRAASTKTAPETRKVEIAQTLAGHAGTVSAVAMFADGRRALSASWDGTLRLWDLDSGRERGRFPTRDTGYIHALALALDERFALSAGDDKLVRVWDVGGRRELRKLSGHSDRVLALAFAADGRHAVSGGADGNVFLWDVTAGVREQHFHGQRGEVNTVALSADGRRLLAGTSEGNVCLWDVDRPDDPRHFAGHQRDVTGVAFASENKAISCGRDGTVRVWDLASGNQAACTATGAQVLALAVAADGRVLCGGADGGVRLGAVEGRRPLTVVGRHEAAVRGVAFASDGTTTLSGGGSHATDCTLRVWRATQ